MKVHRLLETSVVKSDLETVFDFFSKADNLPHLIPSSLQFTILSPLPIEMKKGAIIEYKIRLRTIPVKWKTMISSWNPPHSFSDLQLRGPYEYWHHFHFFKEVENGTEMSDLVYYRGRGFFLEPYLTQIFIKPDLDKIFSYRNLRYKELFG